MNKIRFEYCSIAIDAKFISEFGAMIEQLNEAVTVLDKAFDDFSFQVDNQFSPCEIILGNAVVNVVGADKYDRCRRRLKAIISSDV